jgi:hypothetical protein
MPDKPSDTVVQRRRLAALLALAPLAACGGGGGSSAPITAPTLDIRSNTVGDARGPFTVTFYFSDAISLPTGTLAFSLNGGRVVAGSFRKVDDRTYSVQVSPNANAQGLIDLRVPAGAYRDITGEVANTVAYAFAQPYDTLPPLATLSFGGPVTALGFISGAGSFTLTFSGVLDAPLTLAKLRVSVGTLSNLQRTSAAGAPDVYTFSYEPPAATAGAVVLELPAGSVTRGGIPNDTDYWTYGLATR